MPLPTLFAGRFPRSTLVRRTLVAALLGAVLLPIGAAGAPGDLDVAFGSGGTTTVNVAPGKFDQLANAVAVQSDGKIVTAGGPPCGFATCADGGPDFVLMRHNPDGSLDPTFGGDGIVTTNLGGEDAATAVVIQPDGKIVAAGGSTDDSNDTRYATARYNPNGTLDPTFSGDGRVVTPFSSVEGPQALVLQADGMIVAAGESSSNFGIIRYEADGDLDPTFDGDGKLVTDFGTSEIAHAAGLQADGKLVVAGEDLINEDVVLARYTTTGALDPTFDTDGKVRTNFGGTEIVRAMTIQPDGAIVVGGEVAAQLAVVRYLTTGALDPTFDGDGLATAAIGGSSTVEGLVVDGLGRLVAVGTTGSIGTLRFAAARFLTTGAPDPTFDGDGKLTTAFFAFDAAARAVALQSDGLIVAAGYAIVDGTGDKDFAVARYQTGGALDPAFSGDGRTTTPVGGTRDIARAVALQSDGKLVVAGHASERSNDAWAVTRLDASGAADPSFDGDGRVKTSFGGDDEARDVLVQPDGKIVVAGTGSNQIALARYLPTGAPDTGFDGDGKVTTPAGFGFTPSAEAVLLQPDGKLIAVGASGTLLGDVVLARYSGTNGALDGGFGAGGTTETNFGGHDAGYDAALLADGTILVAGSSRVGATQDFLLTRYDASGNLDGTFGTSGRVVTDFSGRFDEAYAMVVQPDGKVVLAGTSAAGSDAHLVLARYDAAGVLDPSFGTGGRVILNPTATADVARDLVRLADGNLIVVGVTGAPDLLSGGTFSVLKLGAAGALEGSFGTGGLVTTAFGGNPAAAYGAALQTDGLLVAAGVAGPVLDDDLALARYQVTVPVSSCSRTGSTLAVDLVSGDDASVVVSGSEIHVLVPGLADPTCGGATLTNVDLIDVDGAAGNETLTIDLTGGPFMPGGGASDLQQPATQEIEWDVNLGGGAGDELVITGSDGGDTIRLGAAGINLNNDDDADVAPVAGVELVTVNAGLGNDIVHANGAFGADTGIWPGPLHVNGEGGADKLTGGAGGDELDGGIGNDTLSALKGADGADVYRGGSGVDTLSYSTRVGAVSVTLDGTANDGSPDENDDVGDVETISGGKGHDLIDGGAGAIKNTFRGGPGDDQLFGGGGADQLIGEAGADLLNGGAGNDTLRATDGAGTDTLSGGPGTDTCLHDAGDTVLDC